MKSQSSRFHQSKTGGALVSQNAQFQHFDDQRVGVWVQKKEQCTAGAAHLISADHTIIHRLAQMHHVQVYAVVPDVTRYVRAMTQSGLVKMGVERVKALGVLNLIRIGLFAAPKVHKILKKDMRVVLPLLAYIDYLELKKVKPKLLFLHAQMTDLALANNNKQLIVSFLALRSGMGVELGLMTQNLTLLEQKLQEWKLPVKAVLCPVNHQGFGMRTSQVACERLIKEQKRKYHSYSKMPKSKTTKELTYLKSLPIEVGFVFWE